MSWLERYLTHRRVRFICLAVLVVTTVLTIVSFGSAHKGQTVFETQLGADYPAFYVAGKILNEYGPDRLYDMELQRQLFHILQPDVEPYVVLPYANPPFFALPFRLLAKLPYATSFFVWLLISAGIYLTALVVIGRTTATIPREARITALLLALSFEPFIMECWLGGQMSIVGLLWFALVIYLERHDRPVAAGLALGVCLYKPTLLVLVLPMLVLARRFRMLAAFAVAGLALAIISLTCVGWESCRDYFAVLTGYAHSTVGGPLIFRTWKFVDLLSFFRLLGHGSSQWGIVLAVVVAALPLWYLGKAWWKFHQKDRDGRVLLWAATLTGTLVLNLYVGIYDTVLVVLTGWLTADCLCRRGFSPAFRLLVALVYVTPWFSQSLALATGFQVFTLVLAALGAYQLAEADKMERTDSIGLPPI